MGEDEVLLNSYQKTNISKGNKNEFARAYT